MSKVTIELNSDGVRELLKSQEMLDICVELAQDIASNYGGESNISTHVGPNRVNASVEVDSDNNDLLKAMGESVR